MSGSPHVAILGAGILGSATALFLARRGARVALFDAAPRPFGRASRWNEGKIHLGYLYAADPSLDTARRLLPGGLAFKDLVEDLTGSPLDDTVTPHDDTYLVHRRSVVGAAEIGRYFEAVTRLVATHPDAGRYLVDLTDARARRLTAAQIERDYDPEHVLAGFRVPERSVSTNRVADRFVRALAAEPRIEPVLSARVVGVRARCDDGMDGPFVVETDHGAEGPFDQVVNASWEGRPVIDAGLGLRPEVRWSHRYRLSLFVRTTSEVVVPSTVIATGPFGDVKAYGGREFYLSWYPAGLLAEGDDLAPPPVPALDDADRGRIEGAIFTELGRVIRAVRTLPGVVEDARLEGGWVFALGRGSLADRASTVHRRDRAGIRRRGAYFSVDTGKYSIAPWLALQVANEILGG